MWLAMAAWPLAGTLASLNVASFAVNRRLRRATATLGSAEQRFWRALWLIVLTAVGLRLVGVFTPGFEFRDLDVQSLQLDRVIDGQAFLTTRSHEFGRGTTYYPSGPYLFVLPLLLVVPNLAFGLHSMAAVVDGIAPLFVALLARELLMGRRAALIAAGLLALLPIQFTAIWWGFYTNIAGQTLLLLFFWLLLRYSRLPSRPLALALWLSAILLLFSHIGVLLLAVVSLASAAALLWLAPRLSRDALWQLASIGGLALLFFAITYLSVIVAPMLTQASDITFSDNRLTPEKLAEQRAYIRGILPVAIERAMGTIPFFRTVAWPAADLAWCSASAGARTFSWLAHHPTALRRHRVRLPCPGALYLFYCTALLSGEWGLSEPTGAGALRPGGALGSDYLRRLAWPLPVVPRHRARYQTLTRAADPLNGQLKQAVLLLDNVLKKPFVMVSRSAAATTDHHKRVPKPGVHQNGHVLVNLTGEGIQPSGDVAKW
ncbi:hypothetical protein HC891_03650 [Candidatus Gracilibacteria bacterium]|nr:hypothetical protein [Candidatus Gracilibacteria bacterium]